MKIIRNLVLSLMTISLFVGCENKTEEKVVQEKATTPVAAPLKIEVVKNENAREIKIEEKAIDKSKSKSFYYDYNINSEYDPNARPANEDAGVRSKPRTTIDANINVRSPYEEVQVSLLVRKLSKKFIVKCSACHNDYANGIIGPSLLSKTSNEILKSIADFKDGTKSNPLMDDLIKMMSADEIKQLATEIYEFNEEIKKMGK
ncbi:MAG: hypothetical protein U9N30_00660 [Campylobacterota bacterium]|nr:hypothetical protein [Campylobacterota bacterium]